MKRRKCYGSCNRPILTEWYCRFPGLATGLSVPTEVHSFLGKPVGCEDLFGRMKPSYNLAVGKWFTPSIGVRFGYSGLRFKDGVLSTQDYHHIHADLLWDVLVTDMHGKGGYGGILFHLSGQVFCVMQLMGIIPLPFHTVCKGSIGFPNESVSRWSFPMQPHFRISTAMESRTVWATTCFF